MQVRYFSHNTEPRSWIFFLCNSREHHISSCWETINQGDWSSLKGFFKSHTDVEVKAFVAGPGESPGITGEPFASPGIKNRSEQGEILSYVYMAPWFELTCWGSVSYFENWSCYRSKDPKQFKSLLIIQSVLLSPNSLPTHNCSCLYTGHKLTCL